MSSASRVSVAITLQRSRGGQFVAHVKALPGNPYDRYTLATVIPPSRPLWASPRQDRHQCRLSRPQRAEGQDVQGSCRRRGLTKTINRALRRRAALEPVSGHRRTTIAWAATSWPSPKAMPTTQRSPPSATTSASCSTEALVCLLPGAVRSRRHAARAAISLIDVPIPAPSYRALLATHHRRIGPSSRTTN